MLARVIKAPTPKMTNPGDVLPICVCEASNDDSPVHVRNCFRNSVRTQTLVCYSVDADFGDKLRVPVVGVISRLGNLNDYLGHLRSTLSACYTVEEYGMSVTR